jgi:hypothetical protein
METVSQRLQYAPVDPGILGCARLVVATLKLEAALCIAQLHAVSDGDACIA